MKKNFSPKWNSSKQPRKQRKYRYYAPLHLRRKMTSAHLDKALRKMYKKRSMTLRTGDEVTVVRGEFRKKRGKITKIDLKAMKVYVDAVKRKKVTGQDVEIPVDPSNIIITRLNMDDKKRHKFLKRKGTEIKQTSEIKEEKSKKM